MSKPGEGRPFKKDITYTDPAKNVKDSGLNKWHPKSSTGGMDEVVRTPAPERPYSNG